MGLKLESELLKIDLDTHPNQSNRGLAITRVNSINAGSNATIIPADDRSQLAGNAY